MKIETSTPTQNQIQSATQSPNGSTFSTASKVLKSKRRSYQYGKRDYNATGLRISNLPEKIEIGVLTEYFSNFGNLNGVNIKAGPNSTKIAEIEYSQKGSAFKSLRSLTGSEEKSLLPSNTPIVQLSFNDDNNLDPYITASLSKSLPFNIINRTQRAFKKLLVTPSPNTQLDKDTIEYLFQYYGNITNFRFSPTSAHISYSSAQEGVNALFALDELVLPETTLQVHFGRVEPLINNWKEQRVSICISRIPLTVKRSHIKIACASFGEVYIRPTFLPDSNPIRKRIYVDFVNQKEGKDALIGLQEHFNALGLHGVHVNIANNRLPGNNNITNTASPTGIVAPAATE